MLFLKMCENKFRLFRVTESVQEYKKYKLIISSVKVSECTFYFVWTVTLEMFRINDIQLLSNISCTCWVPSICLW